MGTMDWVAWHAAYDHDDSPLTARLGVVRARLRAALDTTPPGPVHLVSACAGRGDDVLGVLADHPRAADVRARLVELDPRNAAAARERAAALGLACVEVLEADAGCTDAYAGAVPAEIVLVCGVFGNLTDDDVAGTVAALPTLCAEGAVVLWTRHRLAPDLTPDVRAWFGRAGFEELSFDAPADNHFGVGVHRLVAPPRPLQPHRRIFAFVPERT